MLNKENVYPYTTPEFTELSYAIKTCFDNKWYFLSAQKYYPQDEYKDDCVLLCGVSEDQEGRKWLIKNIYNYLCLVFAGQEYELEGWSCAEQDSKAVITDKLQSGLMFIKTDIEREFYIKDAVTERYLQLELGNKRDECSYRVTFGKDKTLWNVSEILE